MASNVEEYGVLLNLDQDSRRQWLRSRFPDGARIGWWLAIIEDARFDKEYDAAVGFIELAVESGDLPVFDGVEELARLAVRALSEPAQDIPVAMEPDNIARRFLDTVPIAPESSIASANRRNDEIVDHPDLALFHEGESVSDLMPDDREMDLLIKVEMTLGRMEPLIGHFKDRELALKLDSWFALKEQWGISEQAAEVAYQYMRESHQSRRGTGVDRDESS